MARLEPLSQWFCDTCSEVIRSPKDGYVEWLSDYDGPKAMNTAFRIVHHASASPLRPIRDCYEYTSHASRSDMPVDTFLGPSGIARLLAFLDPGEYLDPDYRGPRIGDMRNFIELARRLHVPYYEEARKYWGPASEEGWFDGAHEGSIFDPEFLERIVRKFSPSDVSNNS